MTDKAVSALTSLTGATTATGDLLYIVDISEAAAADRSKKITAQELQNYLKAFPATIGVGGATPAASGAGISFPATASASSDANTLDDYEEGTYTVTLKGGTTEPGTLVTTTGKYTKIGRMIHFNFSFENVSTTGYSGYVFFLNGVPVVNSNDRSIAPIALYSSATISGNYVVAEVGPNSSSVYLLDIISNAAWQPVAHNAGVSRYFTVSGSYSI